MKFHTITFGCQMNYADTARIKAILSNCGFSYEEKQENTDIIILITCSVRQKSEDKITGLLKNIKKNQKIWITGCMIQHNLRNNKLTTKKLPKTMNIGNFLGTINKENHEILGQTTKEINENKKIKEENDKSIIPINNAFNPQFFELQKTFPNLELFRRIDDTGFLPKILKKIGYKINYDKELTNEYEKIIPANINTSMNIKHKKTAYIPISTGCNQFCSYCIVPFARGLEKNFEVNDIINECETHLKNGAEEIVLLGQIVNKHPQFTGIIKEILKLKGLKWLRYTSPYPSYYSSELLNLHESEEKLCPHIHIPFQSGSDKILKAMNRGYDKKSAIKFIQDIKSLKRDISITTDIIVGFPGETENDFKETLKLVKKGEFDMIYIGIYSPRPGTHAQKKLKDNIPYKIKYKRREQLNNLLNEISLKNNKKEIGNIKTAIINNLITKDIDGNYKYEGYTDNIKQIIIKSKKELKLGNIVETKIYDGLVFKLYGETLTQ